MKRKYVSAAVFGGMLFFCLCNYGTQQKEAIAYVGSTRITQQDVDLFSAVARIAPAVEDTFGLLTMDPVPGLIETEAIYQKVRWNLANIGVRYGRKWKWKKRYYVSRMYQVDILQRNCGYSDAELREYYHKNREAFKTDDTVPSFDSIPLAVARKLFLGTCVPDTSGMDFSKPGNFHYFLTDGYPEYFMRKYYKEKYGVPLSRIFEELRGKRSVISDRDVQDAFFLLSPNEHAPYKKDPIPFKCTLLRCKLFSERAAATGFLSQPIVKKALVWAWKVEIAQRYVNENIVPVVKKGTQVDSAMAFYSFCDEMGILGPAIVSNKMRLHFARLVFQKMSTKFDSLMYPILRAGQVTFLQDAWRDVKGGNPAALLKKADLLRDAGDAPEAYSAYSILATNYTFTGEGKNAFLELARIQTEQQENRLEAIRNYRRYLIHGGDENKRVEIMYTIGFIFDRYLDKPDMAEINYRWVLKNAPESRQARDAEVMLQHLGEPMPGGEDLQAEAKRQGK